MEIGLIIDVVILLFLAATIFYAMRLSSQLKILKDSKAELEQLVSNLAINITRAQEAIQEMHDVADDSGAQLHGLLKKAQGLSEELEIITEAGDSLANRLENLAGEAGKKTRPDNKVFQSDTDYEIDVVDSDAEDEYVFDRRAAAKPPTPQRRKSDKATAENESTVAGKTADTGNVASFAIRDREYEEFYGEDDDEEIEARVDAEFEALTSRAEKDLASALKRRRGYDA
ncbi:MAG: hypothetical protein CMH28_08000 [Micavibrio sp.]|nr:hypothetical protein [Micavibrio sp.]